MDRISRWCRSGRRLEKKTVIITGCNTGIGRETALDMYKRGARVVMACRDVAKAEEARKYIRAKAGAHDGIGELVIELLDLGSLKSIRKCATSILEKEEKIHILINNAGVLMLPKGRTEDGFEMHLGINHFGHALFTLLLLPTIIISGMAKIIFVSSSAHMVSHVNLEDINMERCRYISFAAYSRSKCANILFSRALHLKLREHNIRNVNTYSLHPGVVYTELARNADKSIVFGAAWGYKYVVRWFIKSAKCGAQTSIYCAVDEDCEGQSGLYYTNCSVTRPSRHCSEDITAIRLWDATLRSLDLNGYDPFGVHCK